MGETAGHESAAEHAELNPFARAVAQRAGAVLLIIALFTVAALILLVDFSTGSLRVTVDPSLDPLMAPGSPDRLAYERLRWRFGNDETVLVVLESDAAYSADALARTFRLTRTLGALPGVDSASSLTSVALPREEDGRLQMERVEEEELADPQLPARLRQAVADNPMVQNQLISRDGRSLAIVVSLDPQRDLQNAADGLFEKIVQLADVEAAPGIAVRVTGAPIVRAAIRDTVLSQLRWVVPAIVLMLSVFLALAFRSWRGVAIPLGMIVLALIWTMAFLVAIGRPLNLITSLVPPLLATMGLAYCAHVLSEYETLEHVAPGQRVAHLVHDIAGPVVLTGATTAIGLLAMAITDLPAIREFAFLSSVGVFFTAVLALTFVPASLAVTRAVPRGAGLPGHDLFMRGSRWLGRFDIESRKLILLVALGVLLTAIFASTRIEVGDQFVGVFEPKSRVRIDYEAINRNLGGVNSVSIQLDAGAADAFTEPANLHRIEDLQRWLQAQPEVGSVTSLVDQVWMLHKVLGGAKGEGDLPSSSKAITQLLFFGDSDSLRGLVNGDRSATLIRVRLVVDDTGDVSAFLDRLAPQLAQLPAPIAATVTGNTVLLTKSLSNVISGQMQSIALALLLVYLCLALQFSSLTTGLLASLPTLLQTALYFGALGLSGVKLNATTSLVECLVLGLAVDDTIHYLSRFNTTARRTASESEGAVSALAAVLRPITLTKAILALGFLMLVTGDLHNQVLFGWLAAVTLGAAWLVDVFVTPAFMSGVRVVTLWDTLRLDLGADLQHTIPLFSGLRTRQARIFALMSDLRTLPAGTRVISEGDRGGDVYAVIDGELAVWLERDGNRIDINRVGRGAVLGETGYFGQKRTANVDAVTPVRLLRFSVDDQERIVRQYPQIAARVFLNLNKIQAERRAAQLKQVS